MIQVKIGRQIRALRKRRGWSQAELARRAGTRQPVIARLEQGRVSPSLPLLERIARALGCELEVRFVARKGAVTLDDLNAFRERLQRRWQAAGLAPLDSAALIRELREERTDALSGLR